MSKYAFLIPPTQEKPQKLLPVSTFSVSLQSLNRGWGAYLSGLTGFDSGLRWYVSMRSEDCVLPNHTRSKIYLAKTTTLSLPNRSTVDYWLYPATR